ncbi:pilus assembly protein [Microvirga subterranea]|uniref:Pilus assembly protein CpaD n=1 Tax=Microvirga subterranea TaxID=186651 RepID=A0A370HJ45_9HYPH|nr:pilus assembly protein [Microvirga subterranea]RDI58606.1 hypothetical protein DES45_105129 [Microvirga subterranea]
MSARKSSSAKRLLAATGILPVLFLGACADYLSHDDTVTAAAGDAIAHNKVVHIADPWPRAAANTRIGGNGQRVDRITKQYIRDSAGTAESSGPTINISPGGNSRGSENAQPSQ